jgi:O-antigen biosynthesis protein
MVVSLISMTKASKPLFSIISFNNNSELLNNLQNQTSYNWQLVTIDNNLNYHRKDPRVSLVLCPEPKNFDRTSLSEILKQALLKVSGNFIILCSNSTTFEVDTLTKLNNYVARKNCFDLLYWNDSAIIKGSFSFDQLLSYNYIGECFLITKPALLKLVNCQWFNCIGIHDLLLQSANNNLKICFINDKLNTVNNIKSSVNISEVEKNLHPEAKIELDTKTTNLRIRYPVNKTTLIFFSKDQRRTIKDKGDISLIQNAIESIFQYDHSQCKDIIVVHSGELSDKTFNLLRKFGVKDLKFPIDGSFNFSERVNFAVSKIDTENFIILNDDIEVISSDWLTSIIEPLFLKEIGVVGAKLKFEDGNIQHAGIALSSKDGASHLHYNQPDSIETSSTKNFLAVTGAVLATKKSLFNLVSGFDTRFAVDFNDIDYCLKIYDYGYRILYTPYAELFHYEKSSLNRREQNIFEKALFFAKWDQLIKCNKFYNINY